MRPRLKPSSQSNYKLQRSEATEHLVDAVGRRHGSLDDKAANVLPALLKQGDKVVDGEHQVGNNGLLLHVDVADGNTETQDLLQLELDGGLDVGDLGGHVLSVGDGGGELASCRRSQYAKIWDHW